MKKVEYQFCPLEEMGCLVPLMWMELVGLWASKDRVGLLLLMGLVKLRVWMVVAVLQDWIPMFWIVEIQQGSG